MKPHAANPSPELVTSLRRSSITAVLTLVAIALTGSVLYWKDRTETSWVHDSREIARLDRDLRGALLTAHAGYQDFRLTNDPARLEPMRDALRVMPGILDSLRRFAASDALQQQRAKDLSLTVERWRREVAEPAIARGQSTDGAETMFAELGTRVTGISTAAEQRYAERVRREELWRRVALALLLGELAVALFIVLRLHRAMSAQAREIAAQREQVMNQNARLSEQRDQLLEQQEEMETQTTEMQLQAVELEEHAAELEVTNSELAAAMHEAKIAAEALALSEERYRHLFERNPMPMWVYDTATLRFLAVNDAAVSSYGYSRDEFLEMRLEDLRPAEDATRLREVVARVSGTHQFQHVDGWRHRRKDGSVFEVEIASHRIEFEGRSARLVLAHDISDRMRAERELRQNTDLVRAVIDESPLAIIALDRDMIIRRWNQAASRLLGGTCEERVGTPYETLVAEDRREEHARLRDGIFRGRVVTNHDSQRVRRDGSLADVTLSLAALHDGAGEVNGIVVILADATERRQLENQLRQAQKMEAVGQLAGGVAHDFNNLLTVISSYSQLILADLPSGSPASADVQEIRHAADRAAKLTRQLLAFSRQQILRPQPIALNDVVGNIQNMLRRLVPEDIAIVSALQPGLGTIEADAGQIEQVLMNLVVNARDAMPDGGIVTIETRNIHVRAGGATDGGSTEIAAGPYVMLDVRDTGVGMSAETQARVFEPFFTTKETGKGTGLGLATVYGIVKQSGGHITIRSEEGSGTAFSLLFPQVDRGVSDGAAAHPEAEPVRTGETILIVEDDTALRAVASRVLRRAGHQVLEAHNGREALEVLERLGPTIQLVIADMVMPEMNGQDLMLVIRARYPAVRLLMMSGYTPDAMTRRGLAGDAVAFLEKPFTPDRLVDLARQVLTSTPS